MITGIDHIAIQVRELGATIAGYSAIFGRGPEWQGKVGDLRHAWFQFAGMALDVIGSEGDSEAARAVRADIDKHGEGIWGLGFRVGDIEQARRTLERRGVELVEPHVTRSTNDDGQTREWTIVMARRKSTGGPAQFFVAPPSFVVTEPQTSPEQVSGLDHIVVNTRNCERALAHYGARLGLDLRLDRTNEQWGARQLFFRCGGAVVEVGASLKLPRSDDPDRYGGLAWRVADPEAARARIAAAGLDVSEVRKGRKPGTHVFTVRSGTGGVPTLMLSGNE
jgi:catechol 2,3-dioxygenase-like lactoylglutathione lyase family enzyme